MKYYGKWFVLLAVCFCVSLPAKGQKKKDDTLATGKKETAVDVDSLKRRVDQLELRLKRQEEIAKKRKNQQEGGEHKKYRRRLDSLQKAFMAMNNDLKSVQANLLKCHQEYKTGLITMISGYGAIILGGILQSNNPNSTLGPLLGIGGTVSVGVGIVKMIDSHKYIGKAGESIARYKR